MAGSVREITPAELRYKLFSKKICPICRETMKPFTKEVNIGIQESRFGSRLKPTETVKIEQWYHCEQCHHDFSISELVNS